MYIINVFALHKTAWKNVNVSWCYVRVSGVRRCQLSYSFYINNHFTKLRTLKYKL